MAYIAHGLDCLAGSAGAADGLSLLIAIHGLTLRQVEAAEPWQLREWFYACYREYGGNPARHWDVVAVNRGVSSFNSGWCLPGSQVPDGEPCQNRAATP